jgi:hypothetical protein
VTGFQLRKKVISRLELLKGKMAARVGGFSNIKNEVGWPTGFEPATRIPVLNSAIH